MKMHDGELAISIPLVQKLIRQQVPHWADLPLAPVPSMGTDNALFRLGDTLQIRLPRIHWAVNNIDKECTWLPQIAPFISTPITTALYKGAPTDNYPYQWAIYNWLEGENPPSGCAACGREFVEDIVTFLNELQKIDLPDAPQAARGMPLIERDAPTRQALSELDGVIDTQMAARIWDHALAVPYWDKPPVWVHGDLLPGNMLIQDGRLSGVIDFSCMGLGDPACDLILAWNLLDAEKRQLFRDLLSVDENTWRRGQAWALSQSLLILPYYKDTNPGLVAIANYTLGEIFAEFQ